MKDKFRKISFISLLILFSSLFLTYNVKAEEVTNKETPVGISFKSYSEAEEIPPGENSVPKTPTPSIKKGGILPQTGELAQSVMFILIGWLLVIIFISIYLSISKKAIKEGE